MFRRKRPEGAPPGGLSGHLSVDRVDIEGPARADSSVPVCITGRVSGPEVPETPVYWRGPVWSRKIPDRGALLPVRITGDDPTRFEIVWPEVPANPGPTANSMQAELSRVLGPQGELDPILRTALGPEQSAQVEAALRQGVSAFRDVEHLPRLSSEDRIATLLPRVEAMRARGEISEERYEHMRKLIIEGPPPPPPI